MRLSNPCAPLALGPGALPPGRTRRPWSNLRQHRPWPPPVERHRLERDQMAVTVSTMATTDGLTIDKHIDRLALRGTDCFRPKAAARRPFCVFSIGHRDAAYRPPVVTIFG